MDFEQWFDKEFPKDTWNMPGVMREAFKEIASKGWEAGRRYEYEMQAAKHGWDE